MRRNLSWMFVAIAPLLFASCVMSKKPLSDEKTSTSDTSLIGTWDLEKEDGKSYSMTIGKKPGASNVMQWVALSVDKKSKEKGERYDVFVLPGKTKYISIAIKPDAYLIGKCTTPSPNTFAIHVLDPWIVGKAVEDRKLKGEAKRNNEGGYSSVVLAEPPSEILKYLEKNAATSFDSEPFVFKKRAKSEK